jgi:NADPH2:quinone reductase
LIDRGRLSTGETVLIHGGAGGIGYLAIQMAKARGAKVLTTVSNDRKAEFCRSLGADVIINYREQNFVREAYAATDGRGVDVILDMVGGQYIQKNIEALAADGRLSQIAFLEGSKATDLDLRLLLTKRLTVTGSTLRPLPSDRKALIAQKLREEVWPLLESGKIQVKIDEIFPLAGVKAAHQRMESGDNLGKILLRNGN